MYKIITEKIYDLPPVSQREVFRYAGMKGEPTAELIELFNECVYLSRDTFAGKICYCELAKEDFLSYLPSAKDSQAVEKLISSAERVAVFVATAGIAVDRLIHRFVNVSPLKALMFQAIGAERIETICDLFCASLQEKYAKEGWQASPRFSAGYGDFPLSAQTEIFTLLSPEKHIGVSLTDSILMMPSKYVSSFVAFSKKPCAESEKNCDACNLENCDYKRD